MRWLALFTILAVLPALLFLRSSGRLRWMSSDAGFGYAALISPSGDLVVSRRGQLEQVDARGNTRRILSDDPTIKPLVSAGTNGFCAYITRSSGMELGFVDWEGKVKWALGPVIRPYGGRLTVLSTNGMIYFHGTDTNLYAFRLDGKLAWQRFIEPLSRFFAPAVAPDGSVVIQPADFMGFAVLEADGAERWRKHMSVAALTAYARDGQGNVYLD